MQLSAVFGVQLAVVLYVTLCSPSADRVMNLLIITQFSMEATGTAAFLYASQWPERSPADAADIAFATGVAAMIAPVAQRFYDAVVVQLYKACGKGFTWKGFFFSLIGLLVFIPTMIMRLGNLDCCGTTLPMGSCEMAGDDFNKLAVKMANEGLVTSVEEGVAEIASRAFWVAYTNAEHRRDNAKEMEEAAARVVQARWRARQTRRKAAGDDFSLPAATSTAAADETRPGHAWVQSAMGRAEAGLSIFDVEVASAAFEPEGDRQRGLQDIKPVPAGWPPTPMQSKPVFSRASSPGLSPDDYVWPADNESIGGGTNVDGQALNGKIGIVRL